jgi:L-malate glycosyltransferase
MKKTILIIIDNLTKGGAEMMLIDLLPQLNNKYQVILVTLSDKCEFDQQRIICKKRYSLGYRNKLSVITAVFKLKRIIKNHCPILVHSHLIYSSLVARLASPPYIPVLYSIHGELSKNDFNKSKILTFLEKNTVRKTHSLLAVSKVALVDYEKTISKIYRSFVLPNFIGDIYLQQSVRNSFDSVESLKLVAVGNIKSAKNYEYLIQSFKDLKELPVSLNIYGNTQNSIYSKLQSEIDYYDLKIFFKGALKNIQKELFSNDVFVMSSKHEGFGIAAVEAMASGLPLLLSDLPVFHEITFDNALFFDLKNPISFVNLIKEIFEGKYKLDQLSHNGIKIAKQYSKEKYLTNLYSIYDQILQ